MDTKHDNSKKLTTDQLVSHSAEKDVERQAFTLSDEELAEVYGGWGCCDSRRHHFRRYYFRFGYCCC